MLTQLIFSVYRLDATGLKAYWFFTYFLWLVRGFTIQAGFTVLYGLKRVLFLFITTSLFQVFIRKIASYSLLPKFQNAFVFFRNLVGITALSISTF